MHAARGADVLVADPGDRAVDGGEQRLHAHADHVGALVAASAAVTAVAPVVARTAPCPSTGKAIGRTTDVGKRRRARRRRARRRSGSAAHGRRSAGRRGVGSSAGCAARRLGGVVVGDRRPVRSARVRSSAASARGAGARVGRRGRRRLRLRSVVGGVGRRPAVAVVGASSPGRVVVGRRRRSSGGGCGARSALRRSSGSGRVVGGVGRAGVGAGGHGGDADGDGEEGERGSGLAGERRMRVDSEVGVVGLGGVRRR